MEKWPIGVPEIARILIYFFRPFLEIVFDRFLPERSTHIPLGVV